jgi:hypothetical protein
MNDYLSRLVIKNQLPGKGIRPRLPMRFEVSLGRWPVQTGFDAVAGNDGSQKTYALGELFTEDAVTDSFDKPSGIRQVRVHSQQVTPEADETVDNRNGAQEQGQSRKETVKTAIPVKRSPKNKEAASPVVGVCEAERSSKEPGTRAKTRPVAEKFDDAVQRSSLEKIRKTVISAGPGHETVSEMKERAAKVTDQVSSRYQGFTPVTPDMKNSIRTAVREEMDKYTHPLQPPGADTEPVREPEERERTRTLEMQPVTQNRSSKSMTGETGTIITPDVIRKYSPVKDYPAQKMPVKDTAVQVTIGRIEIYAGPLDRGQKKQKAPPALNLEEYVAHRRKRGAG